MRITPIECTNCGAAIDPENVSERLAIARCRHCKSVFSIEPSESQSAQKPMRPEVSLPDGFSLDESVSSLEIRHRWYSHLVWFFLFICIFWNPTNTAVVSTANDRILLFCAHWMNDSTKNPENTMCE